MPIGLINEILGFRSGCCIALSPGLVISEPRRISYGDVSMARTQISHDHDEDKPPFSRFLKTNSRAMQWLTILLFLSLSSLLLAALFEWDRYHFIVDPMARKMSLSDKVLLFWFLAAKSVVAFLPFLLIWGLFIALGLWRTAAVTLNLLWTVIYFFMAVDLFAVSFRGNHVWEYLEDALVGGGNPFLTLWQWVDGRLSLELRIVLAVVAMSGPAFFLAVKWITMRLICRFEWLVSKRSLATLTVAFVLLAVLGVSQSAPESFRDQMYDTMPIPPALRKYFERVTEDLSTRFSLSHRRLTNSNFLAGGYPNQGGIVNHDDELAATKLLREVLDPGPVDASAYVNKSGLPNVILIIFESFRHSAIGPGLMRELDMWSEQGLRLQRHYSGSNCTHLGLFSLLYGRVPLGYHETLNREIPSQMLESLRRSGYEITWLTSGEVMSYMRVDEFINANSCDNFIVLGNEGEFNLNDVAIKTRPDSDRSKLAQAQMIVNSHHDRPQFIFFFLMSSHYKFTFPPEFYMFKESPSLWQFLNPRAQIQNLLNRYANSVLFLEHEVMKFVRSIDMHRNIIIITGDHGESLKEDGVFTHGSRMSEISLRVPFLMVGPGVIPRKISTATGHPDILPTLLHVLAGKRVSILNSQGRDLIEDPAPADKVMVVTRKGPVGSVSSRALMIISGDKRLLFTNGVTPDGDPVMEFGGLLDETGQYESKVTRIRKELGSSR